MRFLKLTLISIFIWLPVIALGAEEADVADVGITSSDIFISKPVLVPGEQIRIYARINNYGTEDLNGFVGFYLQGERIANAQPISIYEEPEEVFIDWLVPDQDFTITARVENTFPLDENPGNNEAAASFKIDPDTDSDGTTDYYDSDDDGDGILDEAELAGGTDPKKYDTDGDGASDSKDVFPADKTEWLDSDKDGMGDSKDSDDDNDGLYDFEEEALGTDPKRIDSDRDGIGDKIDAFPMDSKKQIKEPETPTVPEKEGTGEVLAGEYEESPLPFPDGPEKQQVQKSFFSLTHYSFWLLLALIVVLGGLAVSLVYRKSKG